MYLPVIIALTLVAAEASEAFASARTLAKGKKVLVIGGTEFIGRHTVQLLLDAGASVEILHRGRSKNHWEGRVPETHCDRRKKCLDKKLSMDGPWDMVVDFPVYDLKDARAIFIHASLIRHYVFMSTDNVYMVCDRGLFQYGEKSHSLLEESAIRPTGKVAQAKLNDEDEYGHNKRKVEEHLAGSSVKYTSLRLPDVWGPYENTGRFKSFLRKLSAGSEIGLQVGNVAGAGREFRPGFVFASDVAQVVLLLLGKGPQQQPLNIASGEAPTFMEQVLESHRLLRQHMQEIGSAIPDLRFSDTREAPMLSVDVGPLDITKAQQLGFVPTSWKIGWSQALGHSFGEFRGQSQQIEEEEEEDEDDEEDNDDDREMDEEEHMEEAQDEEEKSSGYSTGSQDL